MTEQEWAREETYRSLREIEMERRERQDEINYHLPETETAEQAETEITKQADNQSASEVQSKP